MPLTPPADAAIFDFDGVIIDSLVPVASSINAALLAHGFAARPAQELAACIGPPTPTAFSALSGAAEGSDTVAALVATYHERFAEVYLEQTRLVDGIAEVLGELSIPCALATAKERRFVDPLLARFELEFAVVCAPELAEPKARTVACAVRALDARAAVVVGDRCYDIDAARANELRVIAVTWGIGDVQELHPADALVDRPRELLALLQGVPG